MKNRAYEQMRISGFSGGILWGTEETTYLVQSAVNFEQETIKRCDQDIIWRSLEESYEVAQGQHGKRLFGRCGEVFYCEVRGGMGKGSGNS
jgi:hypothetical protein